MLRFIRNYSTNPQWITKSTNHLSLGNIIKEHNNTTSPDYSHSRCDSSLSVDRSFELNYDDIDLGWGLDCGKWYKVMSFNDSVSIDYGGGEWPTRGMESSRSR